MECCVPGRVLGRVLGLMRDSPTVRFVRRAAEAGWRVYGVLAREGLYVLRAGLFAEPDGYPDLVLLAVTTLSGAIEAAGRVKRGAPVSAGECRVVYAELHPDDRYDPEAVRFMFHLTLCPTHVHFAVVGEPRVGEERHPAVYT